MDLKQQRRRSSLDKGAQHIAPNKLQEQQQKQIRVTETHEIGRRPDTNKR
jgi:hypothetical protein